MTKVRVITKFHDREDYSRVYEVGQEVDFMDAARVQSIVECGLGEIVEERKEVTEEVAEKTAHETFDDAQKSSMKTTNKRKGK